MVDRRFRWLVVSQFVPLVYLRRTTEVMFTVCLLDCLFLLMLTRKVTNGFLLHFWMIRSMILLSISLLIIIGQLLIIFIGIHC